MAQRIIELKEKNATLLTQARAKNDEIKDDTTEARAAEIEAEFDGIYGEIEKNEREIARLEKLEKRETAQADAEQRARDNRRPGQSDVDDIKAATGEDDKPTYRDAFVKAMRFGVSALSDEERSLMSQNRMNATPEMRDMTTATGSSGGYTIPEGFSGEIDTALAAWGPMLDRDSGARQYDTDTGNPIPWPTLDYTAKRGELKAENGAVTDDGGNDPAFGQKVMNAYLYDSEIVRVPIELLMDSAFNMESLLEDLFGESLGRTVNDVLTVGDGSNKPNGILTAAGAGHTAAAEAAIAADELFELQHSVDPAYRASPSTQWQFNDTTLKTIRQLKDGQDNYLWQMGDIRQGEPNMILGKPYKVNQAMPDIAESASPILFGDHRRYVVRRVRGVQMVALRERYAEKLQVGFMSYMRVDGELLNANAVKKLTMKASA